jgi:crotonobetainyl-CoA:carnitine CoA-transferase CaiB-like acyl-CoA transferase
MPGPLSGLRVLELARILAGPWAGQVLADLGADVVKVEEPDGGDRLRREPPSAGATSALFHALNRGKRSVALSLKSRVGAEALRALVRRADVLVESFRPGVLEQLGFGYEALRELNPRLVFCALSGYGAHSPASARAGHDLNFVARSGVLGYGGDPMAMPGAQIADVGGALMAAISILAALHERARTGCGRLLDVSLYESAFAFLHMQLGGRLAMGGQGAPLARGEALNGGLACYRVYRTRDGRSLSVAALEPKFWTAFCAAVGREDLADRGWSRGAEGERVRSEVAAIVAGRTLAEWEEFLADKDLCCEPVREGDEVLKDPAFPSDLVLSIADAHEGRKVAYLRTPLRLGPAAARPAPSLGEHTDEVLREAGMDPGAIAALKASGAAR